MTATQIKTLVALWRYLPKNLMCGVSDAGISVEMMQTTRKPFGIKRAETALRHLYEMKLICQDRQFGGYKLTSKGKAICSALEEMGLRREF